MSAVERKDVEAALRTVDDPCSLASGIPIDIVDMGIVRTIEIDGPHVAIELQLTDGTCYFSFHLARRAREVVEELPGVAEVDVCLVAKELWTPEKMAPAARRRLGAARRRTRAIQGIEPWARRADADAQRQHDAGSKQERDAHV